MYSMWNAPSDRDQDEQFNPEPPEVEKPEPEPELELEDPFEVPLAFDNSEEDSINLTDSVPSDEHSSSPVDPLEVG